MRRWSQGVLIFGAIFSLSLLSPIFGFIAGFYLSMLALDRLAASVHYWLFIWPQAAIGLGGAFESDGRVTLIADFWKWIWLGCWIPVSMIFAVCTIRLRLIVVAALSLPCAALLTIFAHVLLKTVFGLNFRFEVL